MKSGLFDRNTCSCQSHIAPAKRPTYHMPKSWRHQADVGMLNVALVCCRQESCRKGLQLEVFVQRQVQQSVVRYLQGPLESSSHDVLEGHLDQSPSDTYGPGEIEGEPDLTSDLSDAFRPTRKREIATQTTPKAVSFSEQRDAVSGKHIRQKKLEESETLAETAEVTALPSLAKLNGNAKVKARQVCSRRTTQG